MEREREKERWPRRARREGSNHASLRAREPLHYAHTEMWVHLELTGYLGPHVSEFFVHLVGELSVHVPCRVWKCFLLPVFFAGVRALVSVGAPTGRAYIWLTCGVHQRGTPVGPHVSEWLFGAGKLCLGV